MYWQGKFKDDDFGENPSPSTEKYQRLMAEQIYPQIKERIALREFYELAQKLREEDYSGRELLLQNSFPEDLAKIDFRKDERFRRCLVDFLFSVKFGKAKRLFKNK